MNLDPNIPAQKHLNVFGTIGVAVALFGKDVDEQKERQKIYNEAKEKWPIDAKISTCDSLAAYIQNIQLAIDAAMQAKVVNESKNVQNRYIDSYTAYLNEVKAMFNNKKCQEAIDDAEQKEFFDTQYDNLERVKGLSDDAGKTSQYLIFGMLGVVVVVSLIIIFKKKK